MSEGGTDFSALFERLYENTSDAYVIWDGDTIIDCNQATLEMLRAETKDEVVGLKPDVLSPEYQPDGRLSSEKAAEMIGFGAEHGNNQFEWVHTRLDGEDFWVEVVMTIFEHEGKPYMVTCWRDIADRIEAEETIRQQTEAMMDMSTPVIKLWEHIVLLPLIGVIDTSRASQMIETLLQTVVDSESHVAVLDVTGVPEIDTSVARHLLKTVDAARMLGAEVIVTGFSPMAAQTLAQLGVDFSSLRTRGSLRAGIQEAFELVGSKIVSD